MEQDKKYVDTAINVFEKLQIKHALKLNVKDTILNYSNKAYSFSIYLEKHFEFYICFHLNHMNLRLYDIVVWLGFENSDIFLVTRNQFSNESEAKFVLENLLAVLDKVLDILQKRPELLDEFLKDQRYVRENAILETSLSLIRHAWEAKDFKKFLMLVESNRSVIKQAKSAELIFKQEAYAKSRIGDGSPS